MAWENDAQYNAWKKMHEAKRMEEFVKTGKVMPPESEAWLRATYEREMGQASREATQSQAAPVKESVEQRWKTMTDEEKKWYYKYQKMTPEQRAQAAQDAKNHIGNKTMAEWLKERQADFDNFAKRPEVTQEETVVPYAPGKAPKAQENTHNVVAGGSNKSHRFINDPSYKSNLEISANMNYALNTGPTILKEELEAMGYKFDASIIRHGANGDYIPTSKLRTWMENNEFTAEQISRLNALVDDRAAFNAKVKEINNRDGYSAESSQQAAAPREDEGVQLASTSATHTRADAKKDEGITHEEEVPEVVVVGSKAKFEEKLRTANVASVTAPSEEDLINLGNTIAKNTRESGAVEKDTKREDDKAKARELLAKDPKKFKETMAKNKQMGNEYIVEIMTEVSNETKEETKETAQRDKERAEAKAENDAKRAQKAVIKAAAKAKKHRENMWNKMKKAAQNAGHWVSDTANNAADGVKKVVKGKSKEDNANRTITLTHDAKGNAVYTVSGYGQDSVSNFMTKDVKLSDGVYTVFKDAQGNTLSLHYDGGNVSGTYAGGGIGDNVSKKLTEELKKQTEKQAQQQVISNQKTNA